MLSFWKTCRSRRNLVKLLQRSWVSCCMTPKTSSRENPLITRNFCALERFVKSLRTKLDLSTWRLCNTSTWQRNQLSWKYLERVIQRSQYMLVLHASSKLLWIEDVNVRLFWSSRKYEIYLELCGKMQAKYQKVKLFFTVQQKYSSLHSIFQSI